MAVAVALIGVTAGGPARAVSPFPSGGADPYDYTKLHIESGACQGPLGPGNRPVGSDLPATFDCVEDFKLTDRAAQTGERDYSEAVAKNPQELYGVKGSRTNLAWEVTTGRPDVVIAVTDSGIRWDERRDNLVNKHFLNPGELPVPGTSTVGGTARSHDVNGDGQFDVRDYAEDLRVSDRNGNGQVDPQDLIKIFSNDDDHDGNGYVDDISGWDFFEGDNDPNDDVDYGHGTGEAEDAAGETGINIDPQCTNCRVMSMRVGDSFVADVNHFAEATIYATNMGVSVIQSALGTLNNTAYAQEALDYAYAHGVLAVASAADESAGHHNMPSALNHTMTVNSITHAVNEGGVPAQQPPTYLAFNGCTNFGAYIWVSVPSTSCSSDAVGQSAGMAGLVYSAALNGVDLGTIQPHPSGKAISAEEAKQVFRACAEDIDFSTPKPPYGPPNNFATSLPASQRFVTAAGFDQISGFGRTNADCMVRLVASGAIPPEADLTSPRMWQPFGSTGIIDVEGRVAAVRSSSYGYRVEVAPGVQPPRYPASDSWTTVATQTGLTRPREGTLATIDLADVRSKLATAVPVYTPVDDPTSRDLPEKNAFRVRVVVTDAQGRVGIEQRQAFAEPDQGTLGGWPRNLGADGAGSPAFDDLDGDGIDELVAADGNGLVHAFKADGSEAPGFPVTTSLLPLPAQATLGVPRHAAVLAGTPAIADLDADGWPEVAVADLEGRLSVFTHDGQAVDGFPVGPNPAFSTGPDPRDRNNTVDHGFNAQPTAADLDPAHPGLELIAGNGDGHVYAWHADGSPVPGWPVLLRDPAKVAAVDAVTHKVSYVNGANARFGRKVVAAVSVADVDGDGDLEVAANVNEEYLETPNTSAFRDPSIAAISAVSEAGNTRTYLLHHDGTLHPPAAAAAASPHPDDAAYAPGFPVKIAYLTLELLPYVGEGSNGAPVLVDIDDDGTREIVTASAAGPVYILNADGTSALGKGPDGTYLTLASNPAEFKSAATDGPSIASLGGAIVGRQVPDGPVGVFMGAAGLRRLLDVILPEQQLQAEDHIGGWDTTTGSYLPGFPAQVNDLQFFNTPALADINGDGTNEVLQGTAMYDLRAYGPGGVVPTGWPKNTGGWIVATPGVGDLDGDGTLDVAIPTREGDLFVFRSTGDACQTPEWGKHQGNLRNTGTYGIDAKRPAKPTASFDPATNVLTVAGGGDDGTCGTPTGYRVLVDGAPRDVAAGTIDLSAEDPAAVTVHAVDDAGNLSAPVLALDPGPGTVVPEVPVAVLLPLLALALLVGMAFIARRRGPVAR